MAREAYSVKEERLLLLVEIEDDVQVAVGEDDATSQVVVRLHTNDLLEALEQRFVDELGTEFLDEFLRV